ncbi:MAG: DUF6034 family protein, partial [Clostridia bacterium]
MKMKKLVPCLILIMTLPFCASAETLRQYVGAPETYTLETFTTATQVSHFTIDAEIDVPEVQASPLPLYEVTLRSFSDAEIERIVSTLGLDTSMLKKEDNLEDRNAYTRSVRYFLDDKTTSLHASNAYKQQSDRPYYTLFEFYYAPSKTMPNFSPMGGSLPLIPTLPNGMTAEKAAGIATDAAAQIAPELCLNFAGMMESDTYTTVEDTDNWNANGGGTPPAAPLAYRFLFTRSFNGIPVTYTDSNGSGESSVNEPYTDYFYVYEKLDIVVADFGLAALRYVSPYEVVGAWKEECGELLSFEKIMSIAKTMLPLKFASNEFDIVKLAEYKISRITFGYTRVMMPNEPDRCIMIPVWDFFGTTRFERDIPDIPEEQRVVSWQDATQSLLTINAVDGSI